MVRAELNLIAFLRETIRTSHDTCIVDQDIKTVVLVGECLGGGLDAFERGEITLEELYRRFVVGKCGVDFLNRCFRFALVPSCEVNCFGVVFSKLMQAFPTKTDVCTCYEDDCEGLVWVVFMTT